MPVEDSAGKDSGREAAAPAKVEDRVIFPAVGVGLVMPEGFQEAEDFYGFAQPETTSSVVIMRLPAPAEEAARGFTAGQIKTRGWTLKSREKVTLEDRPATLVHFRQPVGDGAFLKWSLIMAVDGETVMVTAAFPEALEGRLSESLKATVLSARAQGEVTPNSEADAGFRLIGSPKLKRTPGVSRSIVYTKGGRIPTESPEEPLFVAVRSFSKVEMPDKEQFALERLRHTAQTRIVSIQSTEPITVDGLEGFEILAKGSDIRSKAPLAVYQVMLFDGKHYFLMQGLVGARLSQTYLPEFKAMARSLKRSRD